MPRVSRGGCLVESPFGFVDATIDAQFQELARALLDGDAAAGAAQVTTPWLTASPLGRYLDIVRRTDPLPLCGRVVRTVGLVVESSGPRASVGELCMLQRDGRPPLPMEVVGFRDGALLTVPLGGTAGIRPGDRLVARGTVASAAVGDALLGRVIDGLGNAAGRPRARSAPTTEYPLQPASINPLAREPIAAPLGTGVRAIDGLLTCGRGQRIGVFGGSGVGKSTLLGMMAQGHGGRRRGHRADRRARPRGSQLPRARPRARRPQARPSSSSRRPTARRWCGCARRSRRPRRRVLPRPGQARAADDGLGDALRDGAARSRPRRRRAADGKGLSAVGLRDAAGAARARRATCAAGGGITAFYTVLVEGDDHDRADRRRRCAPSSTATSCCRASSALATTTRRSTSCSSVSRTMPDVTRVEHRLKAGQVRDWMSAATRHRGSRQRRRLRRRQQSARRRGAGEARPDRRVPEAAGGRRLRPRRVDRGAAGASRRAQLTADSVQRMAPFRFRAAAALDLRRQHRGARDARSRRRASGARARRARARRGTSAALDATLATRRRGGERSGPEHLVPELDYPAAARARRAAGDGRGPACGRRCGRGAAAGGASRRARARTAA